MQGENDGTADLKFDFSGKTVFVTGASRGIGREIAHAFARDGARLILSARTAEALAPVAAEVTLAVISSNAAAVSSSVAAWLSVRCDRSCEA